MSLRQSVLQKLARFSGCVWCGALWSSKIGFCGVCAMEVRRTLLSRASEGAWSLEGLVVESLCIWDESWVSQVIARVVHAQKLGVRAELSVWLGQLFLQQKSMELRRRLKQVQGIYWLPVPGRRLEFKDHAFLLAREFQRFWGGEILLGIEREDSTRKQSLLAARDRNLIQFKPHKDRIGQNLRGEDIVIMVDDVCTTGSTLKALNACLPTQVQREAWVLVRRPRLAGDDGVCYNAAQSVATSALRTQSEC